MFRQLQAQLPLLFTTAVKRPYVKRLRGQKPLTAGVHKSKGASQVMFQINLTPNCTVKEKFIRDRQDESCSGINRSLHLSERQSSQNVAQRILCSM